MGRSTGYCFKIIACGGSSESVDRDDLDASSENKVSDKRGWSFRKKSAGQRVLSNTVITEIPASEIKSSEPDIISSEAPVNSSVPEKTSAHQWTEELPQVSISTTKVADEDNIKFDSVDESNAIIIQAAVRKFLAQRERLKRKNIVVLQAAVRGHLVRCRAAGTLRCIQAIVKMQALVRARHANASVKKLSLRKKGIEDSRTKQHPTYVSIEKLLSNRFAIQLLESTPRTKQINIKCDTSKEDPTWKWMERWMSVSSPDIEGSNASKQERNKVNDNKTEVKNPMNSLSDESWSVNTVVETEQPKHHEKRVATEIEDSEEKKPVFGSRKASNPAFIAAQSRFEELTSKTSSLKSISSTSNQDHTVDSHVDKDIENSIRTRNVEHAEESLVYESLRVRQSQTGGSECGTELSITSMLDSPDPSDAGNIDYEKEVKVLDKESGDTKFISVEEHDLLGTELTHSVLFPSENYDANRFSTNEQLKPDENNVDNASNDQKFVETEIHHKSSPEASPRTPSSQFSNNNKTKPDKKISSQKPKSLSNSKKSPVSSGLRNSLDPLPRESKPGKRRNSFGSQTSDQLDQEPRDSNSSNTIPSYMQVTESARAKALANSSPRSSPDMHGKEGYMKKRHSLPGGAVNGRHGSPRMKRPSSQTSKGNDNRERKWQN